MDLSFQEKSVFGSLGITILLFGSYFIEVMQALTSDSPNSLDNLPSTLVGYIIAIVIVEAIYHIAIAMGSKNEEEDERDKLISARATQISYYVLAAGSIGIVGHILILVTIGESFSKFQLHPIYLANLIFFAFIISEVVGFAMQLYYYRRGV
jgi:uncharacterized membrane protein YciS (DUF1049 family)